MTDQPTFNARIIGEFRANHGRVGGGFQDAPMLLLHSTGARSGTERINPMMFLLHDDQYLVFASKAGADTNPDWYHNLLAHPDASIEVGDENIAVRARVLEGEERTARFDEQVRRYPGFAGYQRQTTRVIPVVALSPVRREQPQPPR